MFAYDRAGEWASGLHDVELIAEVEHHAKRAIVDWFAAVIPGSSMAPARILGAALVSEEERGDALLQPCGRHVPVRTASLINGTAAHSAEVDDIFRDGIYHPGAPTIAAALAVAQHLHRPGHEFLRAVYAGIEISTRVATIIQPSHYRYWHTTGTVGTIGAAAASAALLALPTEGFAHALATATTMAAGLQQAFRSDAMSKPLHAGHAADAGALAALAAGRGFTGAKDILEGDAGFGAAMSDGPSWDATFDDLGEVANITQMTFKAHACCGHTFAAIDAALELRDGVALDEIERVVVSTYGTAIAVAGNPSPSTAFEAQFSLQYCVAGALLLGSVWLEAFSARHLHDERLRSLLARVELVADPELDAAFPKRRGARVAIHDVHGHVREELRRTRKGDPDDPLSDDELASKLTNLASPVVGGEAAENLATVLWDLQSVEDVHSLLPTSASAPS